MKKKIKHLLENNIEEIVEKSYLNCHIKGLHLIMLEDSPKKIKLYVADRGNELWKNAPGGFIRGEQLSLGFHAHHCDLTLYVVQGELLNWEVKEVKSDGMLLNKWLYHSGIKEKETKYELIEEGCQLQTTMHLQLPSGDSTYMPANQIHTVYAPVDQITAWFVFEGTEDPNYKPFAWSNANLNIQDFSDLYKKPTMEDIYHLLKIAHLHS